MIPDSRSNLESAESCRVVVHNRYHWMGDPRLGRYVVYVDGKRRGVAPISGSLTAAVQAGPHRVRVRLWWYLSPSLHIQADPGETVELDADIPRVLPLPGRMVQGLVKPWRWQSLTRT